MSELGSGSGSSYPSALDTNAVLEVNSPSGSKTKARAEVPNDHGSAIVAVQTELGTDPAGSLADVKTYLQTEHSATGAHTTDVIAEKTATSGVTIDGCLIKDGQAAASITADSLTMQGEASANNTANAVTLDLGTVTSGDRIFLQGYVAISSVSSDGNYEFQLSKSSGTSTIQFVGGASIISNYMSIASSAYTTPLGMSISGIVEVTGTGTLVMNHGFVQATGTPTYVNYIHAFFLKKQ